MKRFGILALMMLAGCGMVGPDYQRPPPATPLTASFKETSDSYFRPAAPRDAIDRGKWWSMYDDPALDQLTAQVDVSNQNLKEAEAAYRQAVALIRQSQSSLYPTIGYTGGLSRNSSGGGRSSAGLTTGGTVGSSITEISVGSTLTWDFKGENLHNVTLANGIRGFHSVNLSDDRTYTRRFTVPGTYRLFCALHPVKMTETVTVR